MKRNNVAIENQGTRSKIHENYPIFIILYSFLCPVKQKKNLQFQLCGGHMCQNLLRFLKSRVNMCRVCALRNFSTRDWNRAPLLVRQTVGNGLSCWPFPAIALFARDRCC